jgi:hypothetical protein
MRIILKPGGAIVVFAAIAALVALFVFRNNQMPSPGTARAQASASTAASQEVPATSTALLENGDFSQEFAPLWTMGGANPIVAKEPGPGGVSQFVRMQFVPKGGHFWSVNMAQKISKPLKKGDNVQFRGWFRSPESIVIIAYVEEATSPFGKSAMKTMHLTPQWQEYTFTGVVKRDFAPGESQFTIHFGVIPGAVAMANLRLDNYGAAIPPAAPETD